MNKNPKEVEEFPLKQEGHHNNSNEKEKEKGSSSSTLSSSQWPRLKDPRIVRVSRAFGGKDRHSKVCTIRGLRDRRVRLSVPTAIQLYDLQDRLGLNQPSKVVDWLINVAKDEIDQLPPLPNFPPLTTNFNFGGNFPSSSNQINMNTNNFQYANFCDGLTSSQNSSWKLKTKEVSRELVSDDKANFWMNNRNSQEEEENNIKQGNAIVLQNHNNLLQRPNHPSFLGLLNTMPMGNNSNFYQWGVCSNDDVNSSQLGNNNGFGTNQTNDVNGITSLPPMLSLTTQSYVSSNVNAMEMDHQHQNQHHYHQMLSSSSSSHQNPLNNNNNSLNNPSFSLDMMRIPKFLERGRENSSNKEQDFNPK